MLYGLYLSAAGIVTNSHRQDVISNNLANAETTGFKRDLALFQQRRTEAQERGLGGDATNDLLEHIGGGIFASPTRIDTMQGDMEETGNALDVAIHGKGFFTVNDGQATRVTRAGSFMRNSEGYLVLSSDRGQRVLNDQHQPIQLDPAAGVVIETNGDIKQNGQVVSRLGLFDVADHSKLTKMGSHMMEVPDIKSLRPSEATVRSQFVERSNVDPATELGALMDAQRNLEANANMIRYQDQMLAKLVNEVGKIG
jgi:flagellar basal-body rod protein FlgF